MKKETIISIVVAVVILLLVGYQQLQINKLNKALEAKLDKVIGVTVDGKDNPLDIASFNAWMVNQIVKAQQVAETNKPIEITK